MCQSFRLTELGLAKDGSLVEFTMQQRLPSQLHNAINRGYLTC